MKTFGQVLSFILGICAIIAGVYCLFSPVSTSMALAWIVGVVMIADAITKLISWFSLRQDFGGDAILLFSAIISLILGVFLVADGFAQWALDMVIAYTAGAWVLVSGILRIVRSIKLKSLKGKAGKILGKNWWVLLVFGILLTCLGVFLLINPVVSLAAIGIVMAVAIIFIGANLLTFAFV